MVDWLLLTAALAAAGPLEEAFAPLLEESQLAALDSAPTAEVIVEVMRPEQKIAARAALEKLPLLDEERARGLRLLDDPIAAYRSEARARGLLPTPAGELTAQASASLARGDNEAAARFAAEALARDPTDEGALGILKLTKRRVGSAQAQTIQSAAVVPADFTTPPTPTAARLMRETVSARQAGDMDRTLRLALDAMRADPTSPDVQELYKLVVADRAKQQARVQRTLSLMESAAQALQEGRAADAEHLAGEAAKLDPNSASYWTQLRRLIKQRKTSAPAKRPVPKRPDPALPLLPLFTGSLLLTAGSFAWYHWGRDKASQLRRDATIIGIAAGTASAIYFGSLALPTIGTGGPAWAPAGGPTLGAAAQWVAQKAAALRLAWLGGAVAGVAAHQAMPDTDGYSHAVSEQATGGSSSEPSVDDLLRAGEEYDRNGLTRAGRALQKHGHRPGSAYPKIKGKELNEKGREILKEIVSDPKSSRREGEFLDIVSPSGRGARFTRDGKRFRGFLEP